MRHLTFVRSTALVAVVTLFSACGDGATGPDFDDTFTESDALDLAEGVAFGSEGILQTMMWEGPALGLKTPPAYLPLGAGQGPARPRPSRFPALASGISLSTYLAGLQASAPGCSVSGHGADGDPFEPYDGNNNAVGDDFLVRIDCHSVDSVGEGVTVAYTEGMELRIKERTDVLWGWDATIKEWYSDKWSDGSDHDEGEEENSQHLVVTADRGEYRQSGGYTNSGLDGDVPYDYRSGSAVTVVFTPSEDPIVFDIFFPDGEVTMTGNIWETSLDGPNLNWDLRTVDPLAWSIDCYLDIGQSFVDGTVSVLLNGNEAKGFSLSAGPCGDGWDLDIFGQTVVTAPSFKLRGGFTLPKR